MKKYFSFPDRQIINILPQAMQHDLIQKMAVELHGEVVGYTTENSLSYKNNSNLRKKIEGLQGINGFIFFRTNQFYNETNLEINLIKEMLDNKFEIHFVVEKWSITSEEELEELLPYLFSAALLSNPDRIQEYINCLSKNV